jgi:hypothetical protein
MKKSLSLVAILLLASCGKPIETQFIEPGDQLKIEVTDNNGYRVRQSYLFDVTENGLVQRFPPQLIYGPRQ